MSPARLRQERVRFGKDKVRGRLFSASCLQLGNLEGSKGDRFAVRTLLHPHDARDVHASPSVHAMTAFTRFVAGCCKSLDLPSPHLPGMAWRQ